MMLCCYLCYIWYDASVNVALSKVAATRNNRKHCHQNSNKNISESKNKIYFFQWLKSLIRCSKIHEYILMDSIFGWCPFKGYLIKVSVWFWFWNIEYSSKVVLDHKRKTESEVKDWNLICNFAIDKN